MVSPEPLDPPEPSESSEPQPASAVSASSAETSTAQSRTDRVIGASIKWYGRSGISRALSESHGVQGVDGRGSPDERAAASERSRPAGRGDAADPDAQRDPGDL